MARDYDKTHPTISPRLTLDQYELVVELADKRGMTPAQYMRDVVLREHVEGLDLKWPEGYFDGGAGITTHGGKGRGGGRKRKEKSAQE